MPLAHDLRRSWCPWCFAPVGSMGGPAAVHRQRRAGDGGAGVGAEERSQRTDLLHRRELPGWLVDEQYVADDLLARDAVAAGLILDLVLYPRGPYVTGAGPVA